MTKLTIKKYKGPIIHMVVIIRLPPLCWPSVGSIHILFSILSVTHLRLSSDDHMRTTLFFFFIIDKIEHSEWVIWFRGSCSIVGTSNIRQGYSLSRDKTEFGFRWPISRALFGDPDLVTRFF